MKVVLAFATLWLLSWVTQVVALEQIEVIGTRLPTDASDLTSNISVLDAEQLDRISAIHIQQVLSQVPGVNYQRGNGQESLPSIRSAVLTGAGACGSVLVMEEDIPVRAAGFCNVNELFDTHFEQASQIEVVRGANSALFGSNSLTGSINVSLAASGPNQLQLELGPNQYRRVRAGINYLGNAKSDAQSNRESNARGRVYVSWSEDGGYRDDSGYQQAKFSLRHELQWQAWEVSAGLTVTDLDQQTAGFISGQDAYLDRALSRQNFDPEAFRKSRSVRAWTRLNRSLGDAQLSITPYYRTTKMDFLQHFLPGDPLEQNQQQGYGWQSSLRGSATPSLHWAIGLDSEFSAGELLQTQALPTQGSAFLRATIPTGTHYDYRVDARQLGAFAHLRWQPTPQLQILAGVRYENLHFDYDNRALTGRTRDDGSLCGFGGCRYSRPADREDRFTHVSPKLELQWQFDAQWRAHLAVADSFRAPQATELYRLQRAQEVADLDKVRATTFEAGLRWRQEANLIALNIYRLEQRNLIIRDADFFNVDGQRTDSSGVELHAQLGLANGWTLRGAIAYARHRYASDQLLGEFNIKGNDVDTAPHRVASAAVNWQASAKLGTELEIQSQSGYFLDPQNEHRYPGHTLLQLRTAYQLNEQWRLGLRVQNLTDRKYAERADFTSFTGPRYFPGEPRAVFAELRWQY